MASVKSRYNGLIINIPADARGVIGRFQTKNGNELVFEQSPQKRVEVEPPLKVESEAPDKNSGSVHEADIA